MRRPGKTKNKQKQRPETGLFFAESSNVLCLVYPDGSCEKIYLGGGSELMDRYLQDDAWYEGYVLPRDKSWVYVGEV